MLLISCNDAPLQMLFKLINHLYFYWYKCRQVFFLVLWERLLEDGEDNDPQANIQRTKFNLLEYYSDVIIITILFPVWESKLYTKAAECTSSEPLSADTVDWNRDLQRTRTACNILSLVNQ